MKIKLLSLLACVLFLSSIFAAGTTAKNLGNIYACGVNSTADLRNDQELIKITDEHPDCDIDTDYVVYGDGTHLYIYNITTGETNHVLVGGDIVFPKISEERVVYYDFSYMGFKMYDIDTSEETDLIVTNWGGGGSDAFQFFGDYLVYENYESDMYSTEIFLYNVQTSENNQLTDTPGDDYTENPCIFDNNVAWQLSEGNLNDIVMYDINSGQYTRVTNTSKFESETSPSLYENTIVFSYFYYDKLNGTSLYGLKTYDITTGDERTLFTDEEPTGNSPELFGDKIVYSVPDGRLCLYDVITTEEIQIYESPYLVQPWNINGDYVVFTILNEGVYLYKYTITQPAVEIGNITGGLLKVTAVITNTGSADATDVDWSIAFDGGLILLGKETTGTAAIIPAGGQVEVTSGLILGFGKTTITVFAGGASKDQAATVLLIFIKI
jgi:hypothetical protein